MLPLIRSEWRKLSTVRGPWLLLAAGPLLVVTGITGLVQSGGNVHDPATADGGEADRDEGRGLPDLLTAYLRGEQRLGRVRADVDIDAAAALIVGAMHGQILPRVLFTPPRSPVTIPPGLGARLADTVLDGIAPPSRRSPRDGGA